MRTLLIVALLLVTAACTWVKMEPGGQVVRVVTESQSLSACEKRGEVEVSVKASLGPVARNDIKVRDELETLARNEAAGLGADTVQPRSEPRDGVQRFAAFRCQGAVSGAAESRPVDRLPEGEAETYPIEN